MVGKVKWVGNKIRQRRGDAEGDRERERGITGLTNFEIRKKMRPFVNIINFNLRSVLVYF